MSSYSQPQLRPPQDWQTFERASATLWENILGDPHLTRFGRQGQVQHGLDITGYRNGDTGRLVGIQCKCIRHPGTLEEEVVREDLRKAARYVPQLSEYIITTTAENDGKLDQLAHQLTEDFRLEGRTFAIRIWGWGTLQDNIFKFRKAIDAFDPLHSPIADEIKNGLEKVHSGQQEQMERQDQNAELLKTVLNEIKAAVVQPTYLKLDNSDAPDHAELDRYRALINNGNPKAAILVIEAKQASLPSDASASVRSRLKALSAHCSWQLGHDDDAARLFREAAELAPEERRGIVAGILAAIVLGDYTTAFNSAVEALKSDPGNEAVAPWLIHAASRVADVDSPEYFIPESLQKSQEYQEAYTNFLRDKGRSPAWWMYARDGLSKYPESVVMRIASADSDLEEFIETSGFARTGQMSSEWRLRLQSATTTLAEVLNKRNNSDNSSDPIIPAVACNLATLHVLLGNHDAALRVIEAALINFPDDHDLLVRGAHIAASSESKVIEDRCLKKLSDTGSDLLIKVLILSRRENWVELAALADGGNFNSIEGPDGSMARLMAETAKIRTLRKELQESALENLLNDYRDQDEQLVVVVSTAASLGLKNIAAMAFNRAKAALSPESHIASRLNLATVAENRDDWNAVIDALDGYLDLNANTRELRMLGRAFANAHPISDRALRFFENLSLDLKHTSPYPYMAGLAIFKAGLPEKALPLIEAERMTHPNAANIVLTNIQILLTLRKEKDVTSIVSELDPACLQGSGSELMKIAHVIKRFGSFSVALDFGYRLLRKHDNIPEIELLYCGLLLGGAEVDSNLISPECVCDGMWIKIVNQDDKIDEFIIDSSELPSAKIVRPNDDRARQFIGKKGAAELLVGSHWAIFDS